MILHKTIALRVGRNLQKREFVDMVGPDGRTVTADEVRAHWQTVFSDISEASVYLLDHNAANYLDTLRMDVQGMPWEDRPEANIQDYVRNVDFPRDLVWVEYDDRRLWEDRVARGVTTQTDEELSHRFQRGFLFDNRPSDKLTVRLFNASGEKSFFDAPTTLEISKANDGRADFGSVSWHPERAVFAGLMRAGLLKTEEATRAHFEKHQGHVTYEMVIGFMLFAALAAREDDLVPQEVASLTAAEAKAARKFSKSWMTESLKSHVTIRIGPSAARHLSEHKARLRFEQIQPANRSGPVEHWVAEHERRYASGKIVRVKAHKRGSSDGANLPKRVVGPRGD